MADNIKQTAERLMVAIANSGAVKVGQEEFACEVMRDELKAFLLDDRYADERDVALNGNSGLAWASLVTTCVERIAKGHIISA